MNKEALMLSTQAHAISKSNDSSKMMIAQKIISLLEAYHRGWHVKSASCLHHSQPSDCFKIHVNKIVRLIKLNKKIQFILPAFPAKSVNKNKTEGPYPDLGERLSLRFLNNICEQIQSLYSFGAQIIICSDGRVFNDLVTVTDNNVNCYINGIHRIIKEDHLKNLSFYSLDQYYHEGSYDYKRQQLLSSFGQPFTSLKNKVKNSISVKLLFNGIHRFIFEDYVTLFTNLSRNQIRNMTKDIAYQVIIRSNAWSSLIAHQFPNAIRLSIHPQFCNSDKFGIMLLKSRDQWATPWHRVVLIDRNQYWLIRKMEAEAMNAKAIFFNNQFSHYILNAHHQGNIQ